MFQLDGSQTLEGIRIPSGHVQIQTAGLAPEFLTLNLGQNPRSFSSDKFPCEADAPGQWPHSETTALGHLTSAQETNFFLTTTL